MRFGIVVFPGSNCDTDCYNAATEIGQDAEYIWHQQTDLKGFDCLILPGGFSYGDFLRSGAIARFSPVMTAIKEFAADGGLVLGICNGFQILLEAGLLPGGMLHNDSLRFVCKYVNLRTENNIIPFTNQYKKEQVIKIPVAHGEGNYFADGATLRKLEENNQIVFRYCSKDGDTSSKFCPNGSVSNIAGICNSQGNVLGLMPHPERSMSELFGSADGKIMFESVVRSGVGVR